MQIKGMFFNYHGTWVTSIKIILFFVLQKNSHKKGLYVKRFENSIKVIKLQSTPYQQSNVNFN